MEPGRSRKSAEEFGVLTRRCSWNRQRRSWFCDPNATYVCDNFILLALPGGLEQSSWPNVGKEYAMPHLRACAFQYQAGNLSESLCLPARLFHMMSLGACGGRITWKNKAECDAKSQMEHNSGPILHNKGRNPYTNGHCTGPCACLCETPICALCCLRALPFPRYQPRFPQTSDIF